MAHQPRRYPGTVASLTNPVTSESAEAWVSPGNASADDGTETSITAATFDTPDISQLLVASNFGFAVPTAATVTGIVVEVERRDGGIGSASDNRVQLGKGTLFLDLVGSNYADTALDWPTAATVKVYGTGLTDLWGTTWTPAEVNASSFAVFLSVQADSANTDVFVDYIRVTVYFSLTGANAYQTEILAADPIAHYDMDETSGTAMADLIGQYAGTYQNNGVSLPLALGGTGLVSDGGTSYGPTKTVNHWIEIHELASLFVGTQPWSIVTWVDYPSNPGAYPRVFAARNTGDTVNVSLTHANDFLIVSVNASDIIVDTALSKPGVHCIAMTFDGTSIRLYADGVLVAGPTAATIGTTAKQEAWIGGENGAGSTDNSLIDATSFFDTVLTLTQIEDIYAAGIASIASRVPRFRPMPQLLAH